MTTLQKGKDKIKEICNRIKKEALSPAMIEAEKLISDAKEQALKITEQAKDEASNLIKDAKQVIERERSVFESSMRQGAQQGLESLRQEIEHKLFNQEIKNTLDLEMGNPEMIANLLTAMVKAIDSKGVKADLYAVIGKTLNKSDMIAHLGAQVVQTLTTEKISVGNFSGGAQLQVKKQQFTLDMSDQALKEMLSQYLRKDFREWLFQS